MHPWPTHTSAKSLRFMVAGALSAGLGEFYNDFFQSMGININFVTVEQKFQQQVTRGQAFLEVGDSS